MPLLALGSYSARVAGADGVFLQSEPVPFFYLPLNLATWLVLIGAFLLAARYYPRLDRRHGAGKYWILFPGAVGIGIVCLAEEVIVLMAFPLQGLTLSFLLWRGLRVRNSLSATALALVAGIAVVTTNMLCLSTFRDDSFIPVIPVSLIGGTICAFPVVALRIAVRRGVTWRRLLIGLIIGFLVPSLGLLPFTIPGSAPIQFYYVLLCFLALSAVPFCVLVRWNRWVRAVATGQMFQPTQSPSPPGAAEREASSS